MSMKFVDSPFACSVVLPMDKRDKNEVRLSEKAKTSQRSYQTTRSIYVRYEWIFSPHFSFSCCGLELPVLITDKTLLLDSDHTDNGRNERSLFAFPGFRGLLTSIWFGRSTCDCYRSTQQVPLPTCIRQGEVIRELWLLCICGRDNIHLRSMT